MGKQPLYVVKIDDGYYAAANPWQPVTKDKATKLTHKDVRRIRGKLKREGYTASVEPA